ncbi:MAG: DUF6080 domain-containing protein [Prevotella sp.]|nr:DUF6080 domain-containing protein [Prevotella sp.]
MKRILDFLKIKRDERLPLSFFVLWMVALHGIIIYKYYPLFSQVTKNYYKLTVRNFTISGFDPLTYGVLTDWTAAYEIHRHPLLAFFYYPLYGLNQALIALTGVNCTQFLVAIVLLASSCFAFVLLLRIGKELIGLSQTEASVLAFFLFSFSHVMLSAICPDHFALSLPFLLLSIYVAGKRLKAKQEMTATETLVLFFLTAGITLNNGLKIFLANWFTKGKRFFRPKNLFLIVFLPSIFIWGFAEWEYQYYKADIVKERKQKKERRKEAKKQKMFAEFKQSTPIKDSLQQIKAFEDVWANHLKKVDSIEAKKPYKAHTGKPISTYRFLFWTDVTTDRVATIIENLFGESIQLHQQYTLKDVLTHRPVIVHYDWVWNYVVEGTILLLFIVGAWWGRNRKVMQIALSFATMDMVLHIGLGFGINEVYIMATHWIYILPLGCAYLLHHLKGNYRLAMNILLLVLTVFLMSYNTTLFVNYII